MKAVKTKALPDPAARKLCILVSCVLTMVISVEYLTRAMHDHRKVTLDIERGVQQALAIRHDPSNLQLLFAGNSLVFEDLSQSALQQSLGPYFHVHTAGVPGSTYYDWRYGLRSLFARGSQPDLVVFAISPSQFLRSPAVTPLPVSALWSTREVLAYDREQRPSLTAFSELILEHYSTFFSMRDTVRIYVRKSIPGYETMLDEWTKSGPSIQAGDGAATEAAFTEKLSGLAAECALHARLILMIAPTHQAADEALEPALRSAAANMGIEIIEPVREDDWPPWNYKRDGYHLTAAAAAEFSKLVAADLKQIVFTSDDHIAGQ